MEDCKEELKELASQIKQLNDLFSKPDPISIAVTALNHTIQKLTATLEKINTKL